MTASYAEDSENTEPSEDTGSAHDDLQEELDGEFVPNPPSTATEDPDTTTVSDPPEDPDRPSSSPGVG